MAKPKKQGSGMCGTISWLIGAMAGAYLIYVMLIDLQQDLLISVIAGIGAMIVVGFVLGLILCSRSRNRVQERLDAATPVASRPATPVEKKNPDTDSELFAGQAPAGPARIVPAASRAATLGQPDAEAVDRQLDERLGQSDGSDDAAEGDTDFSDEYDDYEDEAVETGSDDRSDLDEATDASAPLKLTESVPSDAPDDDASDDDGADIEEQVRSAVEALATGMTRPAVAEESDIDTAADESNDAPQALEPEAKSDSGAEVSGDGKSDKAAAVAAAIRAIASEVRDEDEDTDGDDGDDDAAQVQETVQADKSDELTADSDERAAPESQDSDDDAADEEAAEPVAEPVIAEAAPESEAAPEPAPDPKPEPAPEPAKAAAPESVPVSTPETGGDAPAAIKPLKPTGLDQPEGGEGDDLTRIDGIGASQAAALNEAGIYHFSQIVSMNRRELVWLDENIPGEDGQNASDSWRKQAIAISRKAD